MALESSLKELTTLYVKIMIRYLLDLLRLANTGDISVPTNEMNFCDSKKPHPQLKIVSDKRDPHTRILSLEVHLSVIDVFPLDREPTVEALHLIKWLAKEKIDILDSNKVLNMTAFILKSSTHNEEAATTCPKVSKEVFYRLSKGASQEVSIRDWITGERMTKYFDLPEDNGQISTEVLCKDETLIPLSVDEVLDGSGAISSTEGDADQDHHRKRKKKKMSYVSKMSGALCDWVKRFSVVDSDNFSKSKEGVILILKETKGTDAFDTYALEDPESKKANGIMKDLQATLAKIDKELKTLSAKRKKTLARIDEQRKQLSKGQEKIIGFESKIHAIEENHPLSEDEVKKIFKLEEAVEMSH
ncbi:hypothetical protein HAX54_027950 [Datura stramonium]|uniref:Uncharacterized protein n=1 Tax=Datura stramonium TaxID=4076 RepID=A0ABS8V633_DATST|nr:hypothetical protein [Datura stramonium]